MYIRPHGSGHRCEVQRDGRRISKTLPTKREAQRWGAEQEAMCKQLGAGWRTFGEAVQKFLDAQPEGRKSAKWERNTLARLLADFGPDLQLGSITQATIAEWRDRRLKDVSGSTVQREANTLRRLMSVARDEWNWIDHSPFKGVRMPAENPPRYQVWRWQDIRRILRAPRGGKTSEVQFAFHLSLRTGMRLSEVLQAPALYDHRRRVVVLPTSKNGSRAEVPVGRIAAKMLAGAPIMTVGPDEASALFAKLRAQLLIPELTFHDARATALTLLARKVDVMTLARISRHKDLRILMSTYYREGADEIARRI